MFGRLAAAALVAASLVMAGCSASASSTSGPSAPTPSPSPSASASTSFDTVYVGNVTLYICGTCEAAAEAAGINLHADVKDIVRHIDAALHPPTAYVDITDNPKGAIPGTGVGGFSRGTRVSISFDSHFANLHDAVFQWLPRVLAHELDETKRRDALQAGATLKGQLITDGLADSVSMEIFPQGPLNPWDHALTPPQERRAWRVMQPHLHDVLVPYVRAFGHWFFGVGGEVPNGAGYTIGYHIVQAYLERHPGTTAIELTTVDADRIVAGSAYSP